MNATLSFDKLFVAWRWFAPANALRVLAICAAFGALPVVAIYYAREPAAPPLVAGIAGLGGIAGAGDASPGLAVALAADDPVARFSQSRIGHILYSPYIGDYCRRVLFHNETGALYENGRILCVQSAPQPTPVSGADRLLSMRKSFLK